MILIDHLVVIADSQLQNQQLIWVFLKLGAPQNGWFTIILRKHHFDKLQLAIMMFGYRESRGLG